MDLSPRGLKELWRSESGQRLFRYTMVSVISVIVSLVALAVFAGPLGWPALWATVAACAIGTIPSYELNRKWGWGKSVRGQLGKEVMPFWILAFIGLAVATGEVAEASRMFPLRAGHGASLHRTYYSHVTHVRALEIAKRVVAFIGPAGAPPVEVRQVMAAPPEV